MNLAKCTSSRPELFFFFLAWIIAALAWSNIAEALTGSPNVCGTPEEIQLLVKNNKVAGWGLTGKGKLVTLLINPNRDWALIFAEPDMRNRTCFIATGSDWAVGK